MASVPTVKVTDGKATAIINVSDQAEWKARGFQPAQESPAEPDRRKRNTSATTEK